MKGLTEPKLARDRCIAAFDPYIYDSLYLKVKRAFGFTDDETVRCEGGYGDQIPRYPDIFPKDMPIGRSPRMLTASNIAVSRVASRMPAFTYPQLDQLDAAIRSEVMRVTYHGEQHCFAPWHQGVSSAFDDGDSIGQGAVEIWPIVNPNSRKPQAQLQNIGCMDFGWDPNKRDPHDSRHVVTQKWVSVEDAEERIGSKKAKAAARKVFQTSLSPCTWSVRCVTYYDYGYGKDGKPTIIHFWGNLFEDPEDPFESPIGRPPLAYCVNYCKPKMMRPLGRVDMQASDFETLNLLEQSLLDSALNGKGAVMIDSNAIDMDSWEDFKTGLTRFVLYNSALPNIPMQQIPTDQMQQALLPAIQWYSQLYSQNSMQNETARGQGSDRKTATQNLIEDRNQTANMGWTVAMMLKFQSEIGRLAVDVMRLMDQHPRLIDVLGVNLPVNLPGTKASSLYAMLSEPSRVEIGADSITSGDDAMKRAQDRDILVLSLQSGLVGPVIDPRWFAERWVKLFGDVDPRVALAQPAAPGSGQAPMAFGPAAR